MTTTVVISSANSVSSWASKVHRYAYCGEAKKFVRWAMLKATPIELLVFDLLFVICCLLFVDDQEPMISD